MTYHYVFQHDNIHNNLLFSQPLRSSLLTSFSIAVDISSASPVIWFLHHRCLDVFPFPSLQNSWCCSTTAFAYGCLLPSRRKNFTVWTARVVRIESKHGSFSVCVSSARTDVRRCCISIVLLTALLSCAEVNKISTDSASRSPSAITGPHA